MTHALDTVGLILFGSGIALLSYVLEVFANTPEPREISGMLGFRSAACGLLVARKVARLSLAAAQLFKIRTFRASVSGSFFPGSA